MKGSSSTAAAAVLLLVKMTTLLASAQDQHRADYTGYKVLRVVPKTVDQLSYLIHMDEDSSSISSLDLDFWRGPSALESPVDVMADPRSNRVLEDELKSRGMDPSILIQDVQSFLEAKRVQLLRDQRQAGRSSNFTETYHTYQEIVDYLAGLNQTNSLVQLERIGVTYENRDIWTARISSSPSTNRPVIYLECGMHAREWIAHATCIWIIDELTSLYGVSANLTRLLDQFDWYITPVSNPDGYEHSWTVDRLWRKNRVPNSGSPCIGVDNNRNFDANFGGVGSSTTPCSDTYGGPFAFSEKESQAMRDVLVQLNNRVRAVVSIHNNAQMWISPYGYTTDRPADYPEMERIMKAGTDAIRATEGFDYTYGPGSEVLYFTSGTTKDWVYGGLNVVHGYTLELRSTADGFVTPTSLIRPVATEAWNGIQAMANAILNP